AGWARLYCNNHDQPRVVSRWGDTTTEQLRSLSAKALALVLHMHRGTPYIYQGEELGMTNAGFTALDQYRDIESLDLYKLRVLAMKLSTHDQMLDALGRRSRDNARTPMQWDSSTFGGFTEEDAASVPWLPVNPNKRIINAVDEQRDPNSVLAFYKELIHLRHTNPVVSAGGWTLLDGDDERVYSFERSLEGFDLSDTTELSRVVVVANLTGHTAHIPPQTAAALGLDPVAFPVEASGMSIDEENLLISNYPRPQTASTLLTGRLAPWEAFAYQL
ncbi:MAG: glucohydrolase, partial [Bifidobacterium crudilactis]|nr:glucohydrolase [Bifidobacterium crudilactis]